MSDTLTTVLSALHQRITELRTGYQAIVRDRTPLGLRLDRINHEEAARVQSRLMYLVPLHRSLKAAAQQGSAADTRGARLYAEKFEALRGLVRKTLEYDYSGDREKYFGEGLENLALMVPVKCAPIQQWGGMTIAQLFSEVSDDIESKRREDLALARKAEADRLCLASLNPAQRDLLRQALASARAKGTHAVRFQAQDLDAA